MYKYYLNIRPIINGYFSVHKEGCPFLDEKNERIYLGKCESCYDALKIAKKTTLNSDGCYFCLKGFSSFNYKSLNNLRIPGNLKMVISEN